MWWTVTRSICDINASYDVQADDEAGAIKAVEGFLGGPFSGLVSVEQTTREDIAASQVAAGYTPRI